MSSQSQSCDVGRITSLIERRMCVVEEAAMAEHLSGCSACRKALEDASADQQLWQKAERFLRDDDELSLPSSRTDSHCGPNGGRIVDQVLELLAPTDDPEMLGRVGEYEVSGVIGFGGMGVVLKGFDRSLKRVVAIKVMAPHLASSGPARKRFAREAQAAAAMTHDNIIDIYGVSESNGLPFLVMPYARGTSLQKRIDNEGAQSVVEVLRIGIQVASGLAAAHAQGLVHRDIKPANILLDNGIDRLVITDFGLARAVDDASVTRTGVIAGTPQYMSPEQARGETIDHRSDLFSLGSLMYALCTGRPPFRAETTFGILRRITDNEPRSIREINPEVPEWLCAIIGKLMAKDAGGRFDSAEQVAELLEDCLAHVQQPTAVTLPKSLTARGSFSFFVRQPIRTGVFLMVSIFGSILLAMLMMQAGEEDASKAGDNASKDTHPRKQTVGDDVGIGPVLSSIEGASASSEVTSLTDDSIVFEGEVITTSGMPLHNAQVLVERTGSTVSVGTDSEGQFQFDSLPAGSFGLKIRFRGHTIAEATGKLQPGKNSVRVGVSSPSLATGMFLKTASRQAYVDASVFTEPRNKIWAGEIGPWIGQSDFELVSIYTSEQDQRAAVVAQPIGVLEPDGRIQVLFHLKKIGNDWLISNAQRTTKEDVQSQLIQFVSEVPKAKLSPGMDHAKTNASQHGDPSQTGATQIALDQPALRPEMTPPNSIEISRTNPRSVVEAYVAAALAGDVAKAASLAKSTPAEPKHIAEFPELLNVQRLKIQTVYVSDPAKPTQALATSEAVKLDDDHKQPNGQRDGFLVLSLEITDGKWLVFDIDFESESGAEEELERFVEENPNAIGLPPQTQQLSP